MCVKTYGRILKMHWMSLKVNVLKVTTEISSSLTLIMMFPVELNPISSLSGFSSITQKREKIFPSNFVKFCINKWVTLCTIKLEDRPFHVAIAMALIKGSKMTFLNKIVFSILTSEMESTDINPTKFCKVLSTNY